MVSEDYVYMPLYSRRKLEGEVSGPSTPFNPTYQGKLD